MPNSFLERLSKRLAELGSRGLRRELKLAAGIDFSSNDYLGFSRHPALAEAARAALDRGVATGSTGSRLLRGHSPEHEALEGEAARFFGAESVLYFGSGYAANLALFSALPDRRDAVIYDEFIHASVKDGARASFARRLAARHNDPQAFADAARRARAAGARGLFFAVESLYGMEGDLAPLDELVDLAERFDATVIVDEAHAVGVLGPAGRGLSEGRLSDRLIAMHGCGKALGSSGALVALPKAARDYLINTARVFLFSTAPPPLAAAVLRRALSLVDEEDARRRSLPALCRFASAELGRAGLPWSVSGDGAHIVPLVLGSSAAASAAARSLRERGFDLRAIRPPTVPEGTARLRISLSSERTEPELRGLCAALSELALTPAP